MTGGLRGLAAVAFVAGAVAAGIVDRAPAAEFPGVHPRPLFATPSKAAYCTVFETSPEDLSPAIFCWTPNDGWSVAINWRERRAFTRYYTKPPGIVHDIGILKGYMPSSRRTLDFGKRWFYRCGKLSEVSTCAAFRSGATAFTCMSASNGLTCTNAVGHGFWIGRFRGYRLF